MQALTEKPDRRTPRSNGQEAGETLAGGAGTVVDDG